MTDLRRTAMASIIDELQGIPRFSSLSSSDLQLLSEASTARTVDAGAVVIDKHAPTQAAVFTFLISGAWTMRRFVNGIAEPAVWIDRRPGSWHGGVNLIDAVAPAIVTADEPSRLLTVPVATVLGLAQRNSRFGQMMLAGLRGGADLLDDHRQQQQERAAR
jgi:hypothetical protein